MKIETRFAIGEQVYYVCDYDYSIEVFLDTITDIVIKKDKIEYYTDNCCDPVNEDNMYKLEEFDKIRFKLITKEIERNIEGDIECIE